MKRNIVFMLILIWNYGCAQERKESSNVKRDTNVLDSKIKDKEFLDFLNGFRSIDFPLNYKKELQKVEEGQYKIKNMGEREAKKYLKKDESELYYNRIEYNYDTDEKIYRKEKNLPAYHLKRVAENFIILIDREGKGVDNDTIFVILSTFDFIGNRLDSVLIGEQFTRENDWISSVILNEHEFKVFKYETNWENAIVKDNVITAYKDKNGPLTTVIIEDYKIDSTGKIKKVKQYPKQYLKDDILKYKSVYSDSDDPMNKY